MAQKLIPIARNAQWIKQLANALYVAGIVHEIRGDTVYTAQADAVAAKAAIQHRGFNTFKERMVMQGHNLSAIQSRWHSSQKAQAITAAQEVASRGIYTTVVWDPARRQFLVVAGDENVVPDGRLIWEAEAPDFKGKGALGPNLRLVQLPAGSPISPTKAGRFEDTRRSGQFAGKHRKTASSTVVSKPHTYWVHLENDDGDDDKVKVSARSEAEAVRKAESPGWYMVDIQDLGQSFAAGEKKVVDTHTRNFAGKAGAQKRAVKVPGLERGKFLKFMLSGGDIHGFSAKGGKFGVKEDDAINDAEYKRGWQDGLSWLRRNAKEAHAWERNGQNRPFPSWYDMGKSDVISEHQVKGSGFLCE